MNAVLISIVIGSVVGGIISYLEEKKEKEKDEIEIMINQMTDDLIRFKQQLEKNDSELQKRLEELEED